MRIDKYLSNLKYGSRTEVKLLIKSGFITVNDELVKTDKFNIDPNNDIVKVKDEIVFYKETINLIVNKPRGYLSANSDNFHKTVIELLKEPYSRFDFKIAGRLDLDSSGLLILTTSGLLAHEITNPNKKVNKVYHVILKNDIESYQQLLDGIIIKDGKNNDYLAKANKIDIIGSKELEITIDEGKFHQVRRMFQAINNEVLELKRIKVGKLSLNDLKEGTYQEFERSDLFDWFNYISIWLFRRISY